MAKTYTLSPSALSEVLKKRKPAASMADLVVGPKKTGPKIRPISDKLFQNFEKNSVNGCWEWKKRKNGLGYGVISIGRNKKVVAHRVSWILHNGTIPIGLYVCHKCDNRKCVNPDHLFLGSQQQNIDDALSKGRIQNGEKRWNARFLPSQINEIRTLAKTGLKHKEIALKFSTERAYISEIVRGEVWRHLL